jgi:hypothetical protein
MALVRMLAAVLIVACAGCAAPPVPAALQLATVSGKVTDSATGANISGATITINGIQSATSGANGAFTITNVPNGPVDWVASAASYNSQSGSIMLNPGANNLNIPLTHV